MLDFSADVLVRSAKVKLNRFSVVYSSTVIEETAPTQKVTAKYSYAEQPESEPVHSVKVESLAANVAAGSGSTQNNPFSHD